MPIPEKAAALPGAHGISTSAAVEVQRQALSKEEEAFSRPCLLEKLTMARDSIGFSNWRHASTRATYLQHEMCAGKRLEYIVKGLGFKVRCPGLLDFFSSLEIMDGLDISLS